VRGAGRGERAVSWPRLSEAWGPGARPPGPRDRLDAAAGRISRVHSPTVWLLIIEDARSALRPRGVGAPCAHVPGVCPVIWHLLRLRSRARLLFEDVPRRGSSRLSPRGAPAPSAESWRTARSSRPSTGLSRAPSR